MPDDPHDRPTATLVDDAGAHARAVQRVGATSAVRTPSKGEVIDRYVVERELGAGGMGVVVAALDPELDRRVALKLLPAHAGPRSAREGQAIAKLHHPNVVAVHDIGAYGDGAFIAMELVEGGTLRHWLAAPRSWRDVVHVFVQVARGLDAAHAAGLVHRDVKPANVLIGDDGRVVVSDFGIARRSGEGAELGALHGTPGYMSPEQLRGGAVDSIDARSDQFSFCVALFEALHGARPFANDTPGRIAATLRHGVPGRVQRVVARGLALDRDRRFPSMTALIAALDRAARPRWPRALGATAIAVAAIAAVAIAVPAAPEACELDPGLLAGRWDAAMHASLVAALGGGAVAERIAGALDDRARDLADTQVAACRARRDGELGAATEQLRRSCLERRAIELGVQARVLATRQWSLPLARQRAAKAFAATSCDAMTLPPVTDAAAYAALYERYYTGQRLDDAARAARSAEVAAKAEASGELELAAEAWRDHGYALRVLGGPVDADRADERAYQLAASVHSPTAVLALIERSRNAAWALEPAEAIGYAHLAVDQADKADAPAWLRGSALEALGEAERHHAEMAPAERDLRAALASTREDDFPEIAFVTVEELAMVLDSDARGREAIAVARHGAELARALSGEHGDDYGVALEQLASAIELDDPDAAEPVRRQVLAIFEALYPADNERVMYARLDLAEWALRRGHGAEAHADAVALVASSEGRPGLVRVHARALGLLASSTFAIGDAAAALAIYDRAVDDTADRFGVRSDEAVDLHRRLAWDLLELGRPGDAERQLGVLFDALAKRDPPAATLATQLHGTLEADLALARDRPAEAEQLARVALAALAVAAPNAAERPTALYELGEALRAEGRLDAARAALADARDAGVRGRLAADTVAVVELAIAEVDAAQGRRVDALAGARYAAAALAAFPGRIRARRAAAALVAQLGH